MNNPKDSSRREFLGKIVAGTAAGLTTLSAPLVSTATVTSGPLNEAEAWFKKAKGAHRIVYDAPEPHNGWPFIWSWVFYVTNNNSGTPDSDMTAMVVMRHNAIPFGMQDALWEKHKLGEMFGINDNTTKAPALRNPFYIPKEGDYPLPGIDGIKRLQERGAMFCICDMALTVYSQFAAQPRGLNPEDVKKEWVAGLLPGIQVVPSGVWAIGRAHEHGFAYCYAGG
ncbi:MAG: Tat (twin-arginine translocation) pathway signal sequence containing protein [Bacteroidota bacterium]|nr:MAG: Tat (twin-arginine translocation) pathway signal sequence containing protein [Bacteroidota bacterium]